MKALEILKEISTKCETDENFMGYTYDAKKVDKLIQEAIVELEALQSSSCDTCEYYGTFIYTGKDIFLARRKATSWYIGALNSEQKVKTKDISLSFLAPDKKYRVLLIADGEHDKSFSFNAQEVSNSSVLHVKMLRRGGFVAKIEEINSITTK
jgi:hypothetical protein